MISFRRINALLLQYWYITYKTLDRWADVFFWPILSILLWGFITTFIEKGYEISLLGLLIVGFIFYQFFQRFQTDIPLYLLEDFWADNLQNVFSTPVTKWDKILSLVIYAVLKAIATFIVIIIVAYLMFEFNILTINPIYLALFTFSLGLFAIGMGVFLSSLILRFGTRIQMLAWGTAFMLQPLMAVFYPVSILPSALRFLSKFIPATYVFEGLRTLQSTGVFDLNGYLISVISGIIFIAIACFTYSYFFENMKRRGKLLHPD